MVGWSLVVIKTGTNTTYYTQLNVYKIVCSGGGDEEGGGVFIDFVFLFLLEVHSVL